MRKTSRVLAIALLVFCVFNNSYAMGQWLHSMKKPTVVADFSLYDLDNNKVTLSDFLGQKQLILFFWTTWCPHCRTQIGSLNTLSEELKEKNIVILAIDVGESPERIRKFIAKHPVFVPILLDLDTNVADSYGIIGVPTFILVAKDGSIKFHDNYLPENIENILLD